MSDLITPSDFFGRGSPSCAEALLPPSYLEGLCKRPLDEARRSDTAGTDVSRVVKYRKIGSEVDTLKTNLTHTLSALGSSLIKRAAFEDLDAGCQALCGLGSVFKHTVYLAWCTEAAAQLSNERRTDRACYIDPLFSWANQLGEAGLPYLCTALEQKLLLEGAAQEAINKANTIINESCRAEVFLFLMPQFLEYRVRKACGIEKSQDAFALAERCVAFVGPLESRAYAELALITLRRHDDKEQALAYAAQSAPPYKNAALMSMGLALFKDGKLGYHPVYKDLGIQEEEAKTVAHKCFEALAQAEEEPLPDAWDPETAPQPEWVQEVMSTSAEELAKTFELLGLDGSEITINAQPLHESTHE
tara:strand:- start:22293 stop:23375 length:1083 start_codon:yes stop_codon:yes gene_type:complete